MLASHRRLGQRLHRRRSMLVGGSRRIPKVQSEIKKFFNGKEQNKTMKPDEAHLSKYIGADIDGEKLEYEAHLYKYIGADIDGKSSSIRRFARRSAATPRASTSSAPTPRRPTML